MKKLKDKVFFLNIYYYLGNKKVYELELIQIIYLYTSLLWNSSTAAQFWSYSEPQVSRLDKYTRSYGFSLGSRLSLTTILILLFLLDLLTLTSKVAETIDTGGQILNGYMVEKTYENTYREFFSITWTINESIDTIKSLEKVCNYMFRRG